MIFFVVIFLFIPCILASPCTFIDGTNDPVTGFFDTTQCTYDNAAPVFSTSFRQADFDTGQVCMDPSWTVDSFPNTAKRYVYGFRDGVTNPVGVTPDSCLLIMPEFPIPSPATEATCVKPGVFMVEGNTCAGWDYPVDSGFNAALTYCKDTCTRYNYELVNGANCQAFAIHAISHDSVNLNVDDYWLCTLYACDTL